MSRVREEEDHFSSRADVWGYILSEARIPLRFANANIFLILSRRCPGSLRLRQLLEELPEERGGLGDLRGRAPVGGVIVRQADRAGGAPEDIASR